MTSWPESLTRRRGVAERKRLEDKPGVLRRVSASPRLRVKKSLAENLENQCQDAFTKKTETWNT